MREVKLNNETVAILHSAREWKEGLDFLTPNETFIQAGTWWYKAGQELKAHKHKICRREVERTQETVIVMQGSLRIDFFDDERKVFQQEIIHAGDICVILTVGHGYKILEDDTKIIEVKNGPFISVEADKELI
jgi:hypothetical protein